jgi:hypothetical protein
MRLAEGIFNSVFTGERMSVDEIRLFPLVGPLEHRSVQGPSSPAPHLHPTPAHLFEKDTFEYSRPAAQSNVPARSLLKADVAGAASASPADVAPTGWRSTLAPPAAVDTTAASSRWDAVARQFLQLAPERDLILRAQIYQAMTRYERARLTAEAARAAQTQTALVADPSPSAPTTDNAAVEEHEDPEAEVERAKMIGRRRRHNKLM